MDKKVCGKCKVEKESGCFSKSKNSKDGLKSGCKECASDDYQKNILLRRLQSKTYYLNNREEIIFNNKEYYKENKETLREYRKTYHKTYSKEYRHKHRNKINAYFKNRRKTDSIFAARHSARTLVYRAVRCGYKKDSNTEAAIGCSYEEFKVHIESQFAEGMSWANRSEWHIDHIKPLSKLSEGEKYLMTHFSNLQPLWAADNLRKSDSIVESVLKGERRERPKRPRRHYD
jgi:hypothetical protein